jgi:glyoxylase-like metal-dependent hydrolase (beta-lactamase superfamily II)
LGKESFIEIVNGIYLLKTPLPPVWSGILLVRGQRNYLIDSGANAAVAREVLLPALERTGLQMKDVTWLLTTHCHGDHIGGHAPLKKIGKLKVAAY